MALSEAAPSGPSGADTNLQQRRAERFNTDAGGGGGDETQRGRFEGEGGSEGGAATKPGRGGRGGRGLHSSTFWLNVSTFCWMRRVHDFPQVC